MSQTNSASKNKNIPIIGISLFLVVLFITIWAFIYNMMLKNDISKIENDISKIDVSLEELKKDKDIQVASLLVKNKKIIEKLEKNSDITKYINHLNTLSRKYGVKFSWFNLAENKVSTKALVNTRWNIFAYKNVKNFIKDYRNPEMENDQIFKLGFVNSFEWNDSIRFDVNFEIK